MSENDAISRISGIKMPDYYLDYYSNLSTETLILFLRKQQMQNQVW